MNTLSLPVQFVSLYANELSHSFNLTTSEDSQHWFPLVHMSAIQNKYRPDNFSDIVRESMELAFENTIVTNNSPHRIHIRNRKGFIKTFPPSKRQHDNNVSIYTIMSLRNPYTQTVEFRDGVENYCQAFLDKYQHIVDGGLDELKVVYEKIIEHGNKLSTGQYDVNRHLTSRGRTDPPIRDVLYVVTKVIIPVSEVVNGRSAYLPNKDLVISTKNIIDVDEHPSVVDANPLKHVQHAAETNLYTTILVDNTNQYSKRYVHMFGDIVEITPVSDPTRRDGFYLLRKVNGAIDQKYMSVPDLEKSKHIFRTKEEAIAGGDIGDTYRKALEEAMHKNKLEEARLAHEGQKLKARELELNLELNEQTKKLTDAKAKLEEKKIELDNIVSANKQKDNHSETYYRERKYAAQDHYDQKSRERSDKTEIIKTGAAVMTALIAVFLLARKV